MPTKTVILVPGFMGSTLYLKGTWIGTLRLWLSPSVLSTSRFAGLALPTTDRPDLPGRGDRIEGGGPHAAFYGLLTAYLSTKDYHVASPYADWRQPLAFDANALVVLIRNAQERGPVSIICHSRGGLVTRAALATLAASNEVGKVARVIGLGVPHRGSLSAVAALLGKHSLTKSIENLGTKKFGAWGPQVGPLDASGVLRSWPSLYELLPDPVRASLPLSVRTAVYAPASYEGNTLPPYLPHLSAAVSTWSGLPDPPPSVDWIDVAGYGLQTALGVPEDVALKDKGEWTYGNDGDGTVPHWSSLRSNSRRIMTPASHDLMCHDGRLFGHIHEALQGGLSQDVIIDGRILTM